MDNNVVNALRKLKTGYVNSKRPSGFQAASIS
jgi:hypothetical protein